MYVYAGTGVDQGAKAFKYELLSKEINDRYDTCTIEDIFLEDFESYFSDRYAPIDPNDYS